MVQAEGGLLGLGLGVGSWEPVLGESTGGQGYGLLEVSSGVGGCWMTGQEPCKGSWVGVPFGTGCGWYE